MIIATLIIRINTLYVLLFLFAFIGNRISEESEGIQNAIYDISWYNMDSKIVRDITFIMVRSRLKSQITVGKIFPMNYNSYLAIIRTMGSYFSVLRLIFID